MVRLGLRILAGLASAALVGSVIVMVGYVEHTYGSRYSAVGERPARIAIADLSANRRSRGTSPPGLERWREAALQEGLELEHMTIESLDGLDPSRYGAVILPEQDRLADADWELVLGFLREGVGVICTGDPGVQYPDGRRRPEVLLESLLPGARFRRQAGPRGAVRVSVRGPLVAGFGPGQRLELRERRGALGLPGPGSLRWGGAGGAEDASEAALAYGRIESGPLVWIAPGAAWFSDPDHALHLLRNALRYATREPVFELRPWPAGAAVAVLIGADDEAIAALTAAGLDLAALPEPDGDGGDRDLLLARLLAEFGAVEREGGLYALAASSPWFAREDWGLVEADLLHELELHNVWIAPSSELSGWWRRRRELRIELERPGTGRARVTLRNGGTQRVERATARVYLPPGARAPTEVESSMLTRPILYVASDRSWIDLVVPEIDPGAEVSYSFRY